MHTLHTTPVASAIAVCQSEIKAADLQAICRKIAIDGGRLVAMWARDLLPASLEGGRAGRRRKGYPEFMRGITVDHTMLHVLLLQEQGLLCLNLSLTPKMPGYPDISCIFPAANRMQRAVFDMFGIRALDATDQRSWLRHAAWSNESYPLRKAYTDSDEVVQDIYPFVQVAGQGVHEIAVGPVHAGIIEPGHFRFSVVGEKILRLEAHLGYTHKGIEKRFEGASLQQGAKLAGRVSGDSTVAYAWAYAMAAEGIANRTPPDVALWLRALFLERERIANHLGDLGYLGNDVAFSFGFSQFWILKEQVLRNNAILFGHRYLMDVIIPGGVSVGLNLTGKRILAEECDHIEQEMRILRGLYDEHAGMQDRFNGTGIVAPKLAAQLGLCGLAGRASSQAWDMRVQFPAAPYKMLDVQMSTQQNGDVAARVNVRFDEIVESLRLQREIMINLIGGDTLAYELASLPGNGFAIGMVEGWRGEVMVAIHTDETGKIERVHPHDPSWQNWPVLEHAVMGNIVPDFPLINKSFNLSYSGCDL
jgi:Ni,Fe-hydrogenase III large subunit